jgi:hypothetical protein
MRSTKFPAFAAAAAAAMLALAPAGASAAPGHHHLKVGRHPAAGSRCLSLAAGQARITAGETVTLFGGLTCPGGPSTLPPVTIYGRSAGSGFQPLGAAKVEGDAYTFQTAAINADTIFYASTSEARSPQRLVRVEPVVTLEGPEEKIPLETGKGGTTLFKGKVNPKDAGAKVVLQRENAVTHEEWRAIQRAVLVSSTGEFAISHKFVVPGDADIRVVVQPNSKLYVRGISNTLNYNISQKENPNLTLNSSSDPIFFGQPVTLSGVVNGAPVGQTVTLLARGRGAGYATAATTTTKSEGKYEFVQSPQVSSFYRVTSAGKSSAVLFEGVKYVLTAGVSATTVQSGQSLTFSGTVTPGVAGHPVYLERENASGGGFHVYEPGTVVTGSTYSITAPIYGSGKESFRIKVPGDPTNQSASSTTFSIEVTPAPAVSFKPTPPSKPLQEGQL